MALAQNDFTTTSNFKSRKHAVEFYRPYGVSEDEIDARIERGEIGIGKPAHTKHDFVHCTHDGRYIIETSNLHK